MALTPSQQEKAEQIITYLKEGHKRVVLRGSAGTGKTYLTNELIKMLKKELFKYGNICVSAPTHKALSVLKGKIDKHYYINFATIHSALMLQRITDKDGKNTFGRKKLSSNPRWQPFWEISLVILDESSMISQNIIDYIDEYPEVTFIYIGDPQQLNPVGEEHSPIFIKDYPTVELTEIIRQGEGNPIIDLSRNLERINSGQTSLTTDGQGYFFDNSREMIVDKLAEVNGSDEIKYLAWTNQDVDKMNVDVRRKIYGLPNKIELGESLIFNSPFLDYTTNEEIKVNKLDIIDHFLKIPTPETNVVFRDGVASIQPKIQNGEEIPSYDTAWIKLYLINDEVKVLHESYEQQYQCYIKGIKDHCKTGLMKWPVYYWFLEYFAQITYNHAITVHKSQGSTYKVAIMNVGNIYLNKDKPEKKRLLYTAVTRASQKVCLYNVR